MTYENTVKAQAYADVALGLLTSLTMGLVVLEQADDDPEATLIADQLRIMMKARARRAILYLSLCIDELEADQ